MTRKKLCLFTVTLLVTFLFSLEKTSFGVTITTGIVLTDSSGNLIAPISPNTYSLPLGTEFRVRVQASVTDPNFTDSLRSDAALRNVPVGIGTLVGDIFPSALGVVVPVAGPPGGAAPVPSWTGYQSVGPGEPAPWVNLLHYSTDLVVAGAAIGQTSRNLNSTSVLPYFQIGIDGPDDILEGDYLASGYGTTQLLFNPTTINVFEDLPAASNEIGQKNVFAGNNSSIGFPYQRTLYPNSTPVTIHVGPGPVILPEPSAICLLLVGCIGYFWNRKQNLSAKSTVV